MVLIGTITEMTHISNSNAILYTQMQKKPTIILIPKAPYAHSFHRYNCHDKYYSMNTSE